MAVNDLKDKKHLEQLLEGKGLFILHFWTSWSEPCIQINEALDDLAKEFINCIFLKVEAETLSEISLQYEIVAVPTVIFIKNKRVIDRVNGAHVPEIAKKTRMLSASVAVLAPSNTEPKEDLNTRLKRLINSSSCVVFMKGNTQEPRCGFSRKIVSILQEENIKFSTFDILMDEEVRQGLKTFSNWPTYPQVYVNGELIGGLDIVQELKETGELSSTINVSQN